MNFPPAIRSRGYAPKPQPQQSGFGSGMGELSLLLMQLQSLKQELTAKIKEVDKKMAEHSEKLTEITNKAENTGKQAIEAVKNIHGQAIEAIKKNVGPKGDKGIDGIDIDEDKVYSRLEAKIPKIDEDKLTEKILSKVPKLDEKSLTKRVLQQIPENKASLKVIQEQFVTDPMSVIDKILELAKSGKFKLKTENIDGLSQTIAAFRNQITTKGYLHGGGTTVAAGTNITLVPNANGTTTINSTGGSGFTILNTVSTVNGSNQSFVFSTATAQPTLVIVDGVQLTALDNNGVTQWSWNSGTKTATLSTPPPINSIFAIQ